MKNINLSIFKFWL